MDLKKKKKTNVIRTQKFFYWFQYVKQNEFFSQRRILFHCFFFFTSSLFGSSTIYIVKVTRNGSLHINKIPWRFFMITLDTVVWYRWYRIDEPREENSEKKVYFARSICWCVESGKKVFDRSEKMQKYQRVLSQWVVSSYAKEKKCARLYFFTIETGDAPYRVSKTDAEWQRMGMKERKRKR